MKRKVSSSRPYSNKGRTVGLKRPRAAKEARSRIKLHNVYVVIRKRTGVRFQQPEQRGVVVVAGNEDEARQVAAQCCGSEGSLPWLNRTLSSVEEIGVATGYGPRIILQDIEC